MPKHDQEVEPNGRSSGSLLLTSRNSTGDKIPVFTLETASTRLTALHISASSSLQCKATVETLSFQRLSFQRLSFQRLSFQRLSFQRLSFQRLSFQRLSFQRLSFQRLYTLLTMSVWNEALEKSLLIQLLDSDSRYAMCSTRLRPR